MIDEIDFPEYQSYLNLTFQAIRVVDEQLSPITYKIKAEVIYDEEVTDDDAGYELRVKVALAKIRYWFNNCLNNSVMFHRSNPWAQRAFLADDGRQSIANSIVVLPSDPSDDIIAEILQSKMNALAGNELIFSGIELESTDSSGLSFFFCGVGEFNLPDMETWAGSHNYFSKPWWARDDASMMDVMLDDDADISKLPTFAYSLDFVADSIAGHQHMETAIVRPEFIPQVIDGGQDE